VHYCDQIKRMQI